MNGFRVKTQFAKMYLFQVSPPTPQIPGNWHKIYEIWPLEGLKKPKFCKSALPPACPGNSGGPGKFENEKCVLNFGPLLISLPIE